MKGIFFGAAIAMAGFAAAPAWAAQSAVTLEVAAAALAPNDYVWQDNAQDGQVRIVVSLPDQRAYVYRGGQLVAVSTVSSGKDGKETPIGTYTILQKEVMHKSNLYDSAPMPFMQRLTWDGVALHAGNNPGFPASHGCVRLPSAFAKKLYGITRVGTTVEVTDMSVDGADPAIPADETQAIEQETAQANVDQLAVSR